MLQILICDDDKSFCDTLKRAIEELPDYNKKAMLIRLTSNPQTVSETMLREADMVFLDIDMGDYNGFDLAKKLRSVRPDSVLIFVTNYSEYAAEGYEVNAFRFLPKPRLEEKLPKYFSQALVEFQRKGRMFNIYCQGENMLLNLDELIYIKSDAHFMLFYSQNSDTPFLRSRITMQALEAKLSENGFLRIHKGFLVNMKFVVSLQTKGVVLTTGEVLPLSLHNYKAIKEKYLEWKGAQKWSTY